ncbi:MAG: hypothetical protein JXA33_21735 [Anaerolineae bacterium]|nr:hypothetical protein [Anaerolineae bacterium]
MLHLTQFFEKAKKVKGRKKVRYRVYESEAMNVRLKQVEYTQHKQREEGEP